MKLEGAMPRGSIKMSCMVRDDLFPLCHKAMYDLILTLILLAVFQTYAFLPFSSETSSAQATDSKLLLRGPSCLYVIYYPNASLSCLLLLAGHECQSDPI